MRLELTDCPVVSKKNRLKFGRGRTYKPTEVVEFEGRLRDEAAKVCASPVSGPVSMTIVVTVPNRRRRDLPNFSDTVCDALNGVWYDDDSQIVELHMRKLYATDRRWSLIVTAVEVTDDVEQDR